MHKQSNAEIRNGTLSLPRRSLALLTTSAEWDQTLARASNSRTVMIDGHSVSKETIVSLLLSRRRVPLTPSPQACGAWEAVKTITSDPEMVKKLANAKKSRKKFDHEDFCMVCKDGGTSSFPGTRSVLTTSNVSQVMCSTAPLALAPATVLALGTLLTS